MSEKVPESWKIKRLGDFLVSLTKSNLPSGLSDKTGYYNFYVCSQNVLKSFYNEMSSPAVLLSTGGEAAVHYANGEYSYSTDVWAINFTGEIYNEYAFRIIEKDLEKINYTGFQGSGIKHLDKKFVKKLTYAIPPLSEQKKIVSILTSADEVIKNTQKQIDKLQDLKKGIMNELLTKGIDHTEFKDSKLGRIPKSWEVVATKKILEFKNGLNKEKEAFGSGQKIVNYMDVFSKPEIDIEKIQGKVQLNESESNRFKVLGGDIFFTRTSETPEEIGLSSVVASNIEDVCFSGFVLRGRPIADILYAPLSGYLYRSNYVRKQIVSTCTYTTRALTNGNSLGQTLIAIPPIPEQVKIYKTIKSIADRIFELSNQNKKYKSIKKSLTHDLLSGEVRVQVN